MTKIELTRRRALGGIVTIGAAAAAAGAGTFALFSDTEKSSGNNVNAGTLDLTPDSLSTFSLTGIKPGGTVDPHSWTLNNPGNITGSLDVNVSINENDAEGTNPVNTEDIAKDKFAKAIQVKMLDYDGSILGDINGTTSTAEVFDEVSSETNYKSLYNLVNNNISEGTTSNDLINLSNPGQGTDFKIGLQLREEAGNDFQADGVDVTFEFILNQQDSQ